MKSVSPDQLARHKHFLRLHYREAVRGLPVAKRRAGARAVAERVARLPEFRRARVVGAFLSIPSEIDSAPLLALARRGGKTVAVPVVFPEHNGMRFALLPGGRAPLKKNVYGLLEPVQREWEDRLDLVIVPGAAFTRRGDRLGAGAGYYDRFLAERPGLTAIGICFDEQMAVRLPRSGHDRRVDAVVTPTALHRKSNG